MIQHQTILKVGDNSGARYAKCLKVLGGFKKRVANIGDIIVVSILHLRINTTKLSKIKKGGVYKAIVITTNKSRTIKKSYPISFTKNTVALISKQGNPIATRIIGPVPLSIKRKHFKFASISAGFI